MTAPWTPPPWQTAPDQPPQPPKRRRVWPFVLAGVAVLAVLVGGTVVTTVALTQPDPEPDSTPSVDTNPPVISADDVPQPEPAPVTITFTYEVTGSGSGSMTYVADDSGNTSQANETSLPWTHSYKITGAVGDTYTVPYVSAQRQRGDGGTITCRILADGVELVQNTASGPYSIVTCRNKT